MPCEMLPRRILTQFPANETILVLVCIEIIQSLLEIESPGAVFSEHDNKGRIPHKQKSVESRVDIIGNKAIFAVGFPQIAKSGAPGEMITIRHILIGQILVDFKKRHSDPSFRFIFEKTKLCFLFNS